MVIKSESTQELVAANIRAQRIRRGWRLEDLSEHLRRAAYPLSVKVLSKTENNLRTISAADLVAFSKVFGVSLAQMIAPPDPVDTDGVREVVRECLALEDEEQRTFVEMSRASDKLEDLHRRQSALHHELDRALEQFGVDLSPPWVDSKAKALKSWVSQNLDEVSAVAILTWYGSNRAHPSGAGQS